MAVTPLTAPDSGVTDMDTGTLKASTQKPGQAQGTPPPQSTNTATMGSLPPGRRTKAG